MRSLARQYRRSLWDDADCQVQIRLEKDALAGVVEDITDKYDVPLLVARGYSSLTLLCEASKRLRGSTSQD